MPRPCRMAAALAAVAAIAAFAALPVSAQERQVYRYVDADGRVVYSDRPPQGNAKSVQQKRVGGNFIETSEPSYATRVASERFPVTLFTFGCGEPCQNAEALLNARGVPFSRVNVEDPQGGQRLQQLTGDMSAPVMQVGDKLVAKGFQEQRWQAMLDEAGYPKAPPRRSARLTTPPEAPRADPAKDAPSEGPAPGTSVTIVPSSTGGGYPQ